MENYSNLISNGRQGTRVYSVQYLYALDNLVDGNMINDPDDAFAICENREAANTFDLFIAITNPFKIELRNPHNVTRARETMKLLCEKARSIGATQYHRDGSRVDENTFLEKLDLQGAMERDGSPFQGLALRVSVHWCESEGNRIVDQHFCFVYAQKLKQIHDLSSLSRTELTGAFLAGQLLQKAVSGVCHQSMESEWKDDLVQMQMLYFKERAAEYAYNTRLSLFVPFHDENEEWNKCPALLLPRGRHGRNGRWVIHYDVGREHEGREHHERYEKRINRPWITNQARDPYDLICVGQLVFRMAFPNQPPLFSADDMKEILRSDGYLFYCYDSRERSRSRSKCLSVKHPGHLQYTPCNECGNT